MNAPLYEAITIDAPRYDFITIEVSSTPEFSDYEVDDHASSLEEYDVTETVGERYKNSGVVFVRWWTRKGAIYKVWVKDEAIDKYEIEEGDTPWQLEEIEKGDLEYEVLEYGDSNGCDGHLMISGETVYEYSEM